MLAKELVEDTNMQMGHTEIKRNDFHGSLQICILYNNHTKLPLKDGAVFGEKKKKKPLLPYENKEKKKKTLFFPFQCSNNLQPV